MLSSAISHTQTLDSLKLHSTHFKVSDVEKSVPFYQALLGLPIQGKIDNTVFLKLGSGPRYIALSPINEGETPHIASIGLSAKNFNAETIVTQLETLGFKKSTPTPAESGLALANTYWLDGKLVHFVDLEGVHFQISDAGYCGGISGKHLDCTVSNSDTPKGKLTLGDINHFTTFVANASRANSFYQTLFELGIQSYQGPTTPALAVGDGLQFLMFVGGAQSGPPKNPARIHHISLSVENFDVDGLFNTLKSYGLKARADGDNSTPPLIYYVSKRMPNRGGAEGGTPEVYFTDPDGILLQVQAPSYCGGGGYLGDQC